MKNYEILEHTADLRIRAFGKTKEELFLNALLGMEESLKPELKEEVTEKGIKIKSMDFPALLVDFLSEVLYLNQVSKEVYNKITFKKFSEAELEAELSGQRVESFGEDIKAVTHHGLKIKQASNNTWEAEILFDI